VQVREAALHDPALAAQAGAMRDASASDDGLDAALPEQPAVLVVVVAAIGEHDVGLLARPADLAGHRPGVQVIQQRQQLRGSAVRRQFRASARPFSQCSPLFLLGRARNLVGTRWCP